jgi:hypothetical protein
MHLVCGWAGGCQGEEGGVLAREMNPCWALPEEQDGAGHWPRIWR